LLDILLLVLQIVTLILLFLFIWWVVRSARRDLVRSVEGVQVSGDRQALPWDADGGWPDARSGAAGEGRVAPFAGSGGWERQTAAVEPAPHHDFAPAVDQTAGGPAAWPPAGPEQAPPGVAAGWPPAGPAQPPLAGGAAVVAAPDVTASEQGWPRPGPDDVQTRLGARESERAAAVDGLDMTAAVSPRLVVERSPVLVPGQEIRLEGWLGIGRSPASDLPLNDHFVSTTHARVVRRGQYYFVEDLDSTNGTFVDERQVTEAQLRADTRLRIGETVFRYEE
jgi:hypothetical protein